MNELKPCPFCNSSDIDSSFMRGYAKGDRTQPVIAAGCFNCGAAGPDVLVPDHSTGYEEAAAKWNARALMGRGEPVGTLSVNSYRLLENFHFDYNGSLEDGEYQLYTQAPAVDDAVLRDAELYRWFKNNAANAWFGDELISLVEAGGDRLDAAIIKAIKGEGGWQ